MSHLQGADIWNQEELSKKKSKESLKKHSLKTSHLVALAIFSFVVGLIFLHAFSMTTVPKFVSIIFLMGTVSKAYQFFLSFYRPFLARFKNEQ